MVRNGSEFPVVLRSFRVRSGLSQAALAKKAGFSPSALSRFESGQRAPTNAQHVRRLAQGLGLDKGGETVMVESAFPSPVVMSWGTDRQEHLAYLSQQMERLEDLLGRLFTKERGGDVIASFIDMIYATEFASRALEAKVEKQTIASWIVEHEIKQGSVVFLDSGTTVATVASELVKANKKPRAIYTNNLFAAVYLTQNHYPAILVGGRLELTPPFLVAGSIAGDDSVRQLRRLSFDVSVIGATFVDWLYGPYSLYPTQRMVKKAAMERSSRVVVAVDHRKLMQRPSEAYKPVLAGPSGDRLNEASKKWARILGWHQVAVVTCPETNPSLRANLVRRVLDEAKLRFGNALVVIEAREENIQKMGASAMMEADGSVNSTLLGQLGLPPGWRGYTNSRR